jgi:hypothetical protein
MSKRFMGGRGTGGGNRTVPRTGRKTPAPRERIVPREISYNLYIQQLFFARTIKNNPAKLPPIR